MFSLECYVYFSMRSENDMKWLVLRLLACCLANPETPHCLLFPRVTRSKEIDQKEESTFLWENDELSKQKGLFLTRNNAGKNEEAKSRRPQRSHFGACPLLLIAHYFTSLPIAFTFGSHMTTRGFLMSSWLRRRFESRFPVHRETTRLAAILAIHEGTFFWPQVCTIRPIIGFLIICLTQPFFTA